MCGIAGTLNVGDEPLLREMIASLRHRGPDDDGVWQAASPGGGRVELGSCRLAIQDLSPEGHMPMASEDGLVAVTFNGEIYNFRALREELAALGWRFRSMSDTEVLLAAYRQWGHACLDRLNGMFAFAIYDSGRRSLFLARDRAGEKPLYYWREGERFAFASELKALLMVPGVPRRVDARALNAYFARGYVPGALCMVQGVAKLPPATAMTVDVDTGECATWRYWDLPSAPDGVDVAKGELVSELESLLQDSVRLRLVADVPVGVLLSGGVDSSLVAALAARATAGSLKTFTVSFPGAGAFDERAHARLVAAHLGTDHVEVEAEAGNVGLLSELVHYCDEPVADSSIIPTYLVSRVTRRSVTVALSGDGGDELFAGYPHYAELPRRLERWQSVPPLVRRAAGAGAARWLPPVPGRSYLSSLRGTVKEAAATTTPYFDADLRRRLFSQRLRTEIGNHWPAPENDRWSMLDGTDAADVVDAMTRLDFRTYLPDDVLVKVDRASMAASLEMRAPWLDHRLIEFAFGRVPAAHRVAGGARKLLPRELAKRLLPAAFDADRKQGFSIPLDRWLSWDEGSPLRELLLSYRGPLFRPEALRALVGGARRGQRNAARVFALASFLLWQQHFGIGDP